MYGPDSYVKRSIVDSRATGLGYDTAYNRDYYPNRPASPRQNIRQINVPQRQIDLANIKEIDRVRVQRQRSYQALTDRLGFLQHQNRRLAQQAAAWNDRVSQLAHFKNQQLSVNDQLHQTQLQNYRRHNFSQIQAMAQQINMLKNRIVGRENQIDDLKVSNEHLQNDRRILQQTDLRLKDLEMKTAAMLSQLNARNVDCDKLAMRASQLQTRLGQTQDQNDQIRNLIDGKTRQNGALEAKIGQCQVDMANLRNEQTLDKQNQGRLLAQIHQLDLKISHQQGQIDQLKTVNRGQYDKYRDYAQRLKAQHLDRERQAAQLRQNNTTLLDNLNAMKLRQYQLRQQVAVIRQRYDIYNTQKQQHIQALQDQITVLRNQISLKQRQLLNTSQKINRAQNKIDQLLAQNNDLLNAIDQIKRDIDDLERAHLQQLQDRDGRHRQDLDIMDRNFNDTVDSYLHQIQDLKNLVQKKQADILALKKQYLNQAQQNQTLMRRQQGIIDQINQVKIRVQQIQREKQLQLANRDQKQRNQLDNVRKIHTAQLQNLRAQNNQLQILLRDRMQQNQRLKAQGRNLVDNLQAVKASQSRLFNQNQQLKHKTVQLQFFKNKQVAGHQDLRRSHTIANSKQHQNQVQALQNTLLQLRMKCDAKAKQSQQWRRNFYNIRQGRPYAN